MSILKDQIENVFAAELQFRLSSAVRLAVTMERQILDLPMEWTHGKHRVTYEEIALRQDQATYAAGHLQRSSTFTMVVTIKDAIEAIIPGLSELKRKDDATIRLKIASVSMKPWKCSDEQVAIAYHIARLIRNAFAHAPFQPTWMVGLDHQNKNFEIPGVVSLDTTGLDKTSFDWWHYGGPIAMFRFSRFVRTEILGDQPATRNSIPIPIERIFQIGDLIVKKLENIPENADGMDFKPLPDGSIPLGNDYSITPGKSDR
jgi:hypothetical protein